MANFKQLRLQLIESELNVAECQFLENKKMLEEKREEVSKFAIEWMQFKLDSYFMQCDNSKRNIIVRKLCNLYGSQFVVPETLNGFINLSLHQPVPDFATWFL